MRDMIACEFIANGGADQEIETKERYEDIVQRMK